MLIYLLLGLWWAFAIRFLPQFLRPKPSAKTGVRTYISSSIMMDNLVIKCFGQSALGKISDGLQEEPDSDDENSKRSPEKAVNPSIIDTANNRMKSGNGKIKKVGPTSTGSANTKWAAKTDKDSIAIVGLFVYMWIAPILRKRQLGDILFEKGKQMCRDLGAGFMILVHDDDGSGKLIEYYKDRNFKPIFDVIDKGMLGKL
jgi:hypothetical protein